MWMVPLVISVVVPARNAGAVLGGQLAALCAQSYQGEWEVIIADNGSSDDTAAVARTWVNRLPGLRVVPASGTRGPGAARNVGARSAAGDLLAFCDADDQVASGWLAECEKALADTDVVAGAIDITTLAYPPEELRYFNTEMFEFLPAGLGANLAARRDAFLDLGGFDETMRVGEDIDFCWRSQLAGLRYSEAPDALVVKRPPNRTLEILRKTFSYGRSDAALYSRYRAKGMPRHLGRTVRVPAWLLRHPHFLLRPQGRKQWLWLGGTYAGRLVGSVEHRALYP
jgi:glycosyltransferase involved in cell wall biosynthesis